MQQNLKTMVLIFAGFLLLLLVTAFIDLGAGTKENSKSVAVGDALQKSATDIEGLKPNIEMDTDLVDIKTALLANGCFWCAEADLEKVPGVISVVSGYAGGTGQNPTYENHAALGHREVVLVTYDESKVTFANLVEFTIKNGDPTDAEGSFNDRGPQYVPAIYVESEEEREVAEKIISAVDALQVFSSPLPLSVLPRAEFWPAEEYHQNFAEKNPLKYGYYRVASGRTAFIKKYWGEESAKFTFSAQPEAGAFDTFTENSWDNFKKPTAAVLRSSLTPIQYKVTQEDGTERPFENVYDSNEEPGIYIDIVSGEPLFLSIDKYDSGTGWPSFVKPIKEEVVTLHEDNTLFSTRTEVRSRFADSHLGHVFEDGPKDRGGLRYCMNSAALRFIAQADMEQEGYGYLLLLLK